GNMATVIGIFEEHYIKNKPLPVVKPGFQSRRFTHIKDTIKICFKAWKKKKCRYYSITNKESYSILEVAKLFGSKIKFLPPRKGERFASALNTSNLSGNLYKNFGKIKLSNYIKEFLKTNKKSIY
ncbi:MAG: ADP-L-glycero-D-manno-heptose-6-epimerase, partial [Proteobacteria bacterium]|nr:ADP-L-glycero-D-manno-heptose-6-epimerase [Pseudomonadota bacterium]